MGNEDDRRTKLPPHVDEILAHILGRQFVQRRKRLVHEHDVWPDGLGAQAQGQSVTLMTEAVFARSMIRVFTRR
ncbi:MAG: hypothetical protein H0U69_04435 [Trueperaceae bacterium]|nr:hypothetical protein [Trueperaceae bacterium]